MKITDLKKEYDKVVFEHLNLEIPDHEITVIMGASGCGKTSLLRILMGLEKYQAGTLAGIPKKFSAVFQEDLLCEQLTAVENVKLVMQTGKQRGRKQTGKQRARQQTGEMRGRMQAENNAPVPSTVSQIEASISDAFLSLGISTDEQKKPVCEYSGGMKRRVAIVRAMMAESDCILLDEPCKGLDTETKDRVIEYMLKMRNGRTMVVVTHDAEEARLYSGQLVKL